MTTTKCTCGNFGCAKREALGLVPFCQIVSKEEPRNPLSFGSYKAAAAFAAANGMQVNKRGFSALSSGSGLRFTVSAL